MQSQKGHGEARGKAQRGPRLQEPAVASRCIHRTSSRKNFSQGRKDRQRAQEGRVTLREEAGSRRAVNVPSGLELGPASPPSRATLQLCSPLVHYYYNSPNSSPPGTFAPLLPPRAPFLHLT